jgi:cation transport ATPase
VLLFYQIKTVIFDKTGTLTHGKPKVTKAILFVSEAICSLKLFSAIVGVAEKDSEHPLGLAVTNFAKHVSSEIRELPILSNWTRFSLDGATQCPLD